MEDVKWILKLGTHASPYLHSQPPTSLLELPNHTAEWAYEIDRALTVRMVLCCSTAHSPQWAGTQGEGPDDRGPSVPCLGSFTMKDLSVIQSQFQNLILFFVAFWLLFCFILSESNMSAFPRSCSIWVLSWPCSISSFLKQAHTFSAPSHSVYLMIKTSAFLPVWLGVRRHFSNKPRDGNMIIFSLFHSVFFSFFVSTRLCVSCVFCLRRRLTWHRDCTVLTWHALLQWSHLPTLVTLESTSLLLSNFPGLQVSI